MKKILLVMAAAAIMAACGSKTQPAGTGQAAASGTEQYFGEKISADGAIPISELSALMGDKKEVRVKLTAPVAAVCQKKGCWMDVKNADGSDMRVTFKDYAFFVPKDASGKEATIEGVARIEETSVADLKEYAKDAGKPQEEIDAISEPQKELVFEANGVILK